MNPIRSGILALSLAAGLAPAQTPVQGPEPTVVTVTGQAMPVSASAASVSVLTRGAIEESHAGALTELLRQTPFLFLTQSGGRGGLTTVTLRGGKPNFTLVMLDGIPMNDVTNVLGGSYDFSTMSTDNIEQVEIVRGPLSSVYGSDAVAGVINIISRRGEGKSSLSTRATFGNFATKEIRAGASGKVRLFDFAVSGSCQDIGVQVEKDPFRLGTIGLSSRLTIDSRRVLAVTIRYANHRVAGFPPNGGGPEFSIGRQPQSGRAREITSGAAWHHQLTTRWLYTVDFGVFDRGARSSVPAILDAPTPTFRSVPSAQSQADFRRLQAGVSNYARLWRNFSATAGAGFKREAGASAGLLADRIPDSFGITRNTASANAELAYHDERLSATLGVRGDRAAGFHTVWSPRAGVSYRIVHGPRVRWSWGKGFKLPSFYALADPIVGNRALRPEFASSMEAGVEGDVVRNRVHANLTVFRNSYRDLVDFSAQLFRLVNRSAARTRGVEFAVTVPLSPRLELGGRLLYLDWQLTGTTEPLRDQPHWQSGGTLTWTPSRRWRSRIDTVWVGRRYDFSVPVQSQTTVGGYSATNAVTTYEWSSKVATFVRADNLFNARFHEFIGFPNPGVWIRGGVELRLR